MKPSPRVAAEEAVGATMMAMEEAATVVEDTTVVDMEAVAVVSTLVKSTQQLENLERFLTLCIGSGGGGYDDRGGYGGGGGGYGGGRGGGGGEFILVV